MTLFERVWKYGKVRRKDDKKLGVSAYPRKKRGF